MSITNCFIICYNDDGDNMKEKKLFLFDMDGTLIDWRQGIIKPSKKAVTAFHELKKQGHLVMIASGRLVPLITIPLEDFKFDGYLLSDGAHVIVDNQELVTQPLHQDDVDEAIGLAKSLDLEYGLLFKDGAYVKENGIIGPFLKKACFDMEAITYSDASKEAFKLYIHCPKEKQGMIVDKLSKFNLAFEDDYDLIELRNKNCSKASGLKKILKLVEVSEDNTYFFGDGFNDVEIFKMVKHPFVMGNANHNLYQYGTVCKRVEEDGVAVKMEELLGL